MKIYFIRHGQTVCNAANVHQGWGPISLSAKGFEQAAKAREFLQGVTFDKYYVSDLLRTRQTAEVIFPDEYHSGKISFEENLREIDTGAFFGKTAEQMRARFGDEYMKRRPRMAYGVFGGEDYEALCRRVGKFMAVLENTINNSEYTGNIAVVAHGGVIRAFTTLVIARFGNKSNFDVNVEDIDYAALPYAPFNASNCSVNIFEYKKSNGWYIDQLNINTQG